MASLGATYDASQGDQMSDRSALPPGEYLAAIAKSDVSDTTKKGDGRKVELEFEVLDGAHRGRRFWTTLNLWNPNPVAVEIAQRELNSHLPRGRQAAGRRHRGTARHPDAGEARLPEGQRRGNEPKGYKPAAGAAPSSPGAGATAAAGAPATKRGPWA